ncbi:MAG: phosphatase PAP2 family protein [Patescibacteria group bacterium]|nr:phosphatase PAP2 family protein [Patescibacteria group bacterium]
MNNYINKAIVGFFIGLIIFLMIIVLVGNESLFLFINQTLGNQYLDFVVLYIFIPLFISMGVIPGMLFVFKKDVSGFFTLLSGGLCYLAGNLVKLIFKMPRPYTVLPDVRIIGPWHMSQYSFPSTTTMLAFGLAFAFFLEKRNKLSYVFLGLAGLVGFTVIYTGFHFPYDVLFGILLSLLFVYLLKKIKDKLFNEKRLHS